MSKKSSSKDKKEKVEYDIDLEIETEVSILTTTINELKLENSRLKQIIVDNELEEELGEIELKSDEELICINEISKLKELSDKALFTQEDAKTLDILYKNLRLIRGQSTQKSKSTKKKVSTAELFKIVQGD